MILTPQAITRSADHRYTYQGLATASRANRRLPPGAATWHGRRGSVILGPTEHRVARYLADLCRHGRITIRTTAIAEACRLERSEAYRITARLRVLGLFGIENDRAGTRGGRRIWRTAIEHEIGALDSSRHRTAWARTLAWANAHRRRAAARLASVRDHMRPAAGQRSAEARRPGRPVATPAASPPAGSGTTFAERMRAAGLGGLMNAWGIPE